MNAIQIFNNPKFGEIPKSEDNLWLGRVYAVQYGNFIKIGSSKKMRSRISALRRAANYAMVEIGSVVITPAHTNYQDNEKLLHQKFAEQRVPKTELFQISLEDFISAVGTLNLKDESNVLDARVSERVALLKEVLLNA